MTVNGLVVERHRQHCTIEGSDLSRHKCRPATRRIRPLVGDNVEWQPNASGGGVITAVAPRDTVLTRIDSQGNRQDIAANLSQLLIVVAPEPPIDWLVLDHYLVAAELARFKAVIIYNKTDIEPIVPSALADYSPIAEVIAMSTKTGESTEKLLQCCAGNRSALVGQSGVGKSSILNLLLGERLQAVGSLSEKVSLGRHTTSSASLYRLDNGGELIDSPGVRQYAPYIAHESEVASGFVEFKQRLGECRFDNCQHIAEPNCAIKSAVENGEIPERRYNNFVRLHKLVAELSKKH